MREEVKRRIPCADFCCLVDSKVMAVLSIILIQFPSIFSSNSFTQNDDLIERIVAQHTSIHINWTGTSFSPPSPIFSSFSIFIFIFHTATSLSIPCQIQESDLHQKDEEEEEEDKN